MTSRIGFFVQVMLARAYPRVVGLLRLPGWIALETVLPILSVSAFAFIYRAMHAPEAFIGFVVLGGAMTAFWLNVLWSMGAQFYWDRDCGNLELFIVSPAPLMAILAGMALGGIFVTLVRAATIIVVGVVVFHVPLTPSSWWSLTGVFLLTMVALYGLGMVFASVFLLWGRQALHVVSLLQEPVYLVSGLNFPATTLGTTVATIAAILPLTLGVDALRQIVFPGGEANGLLPVWIEVIILIVMSVLLIALARYLLVRLERKAREEGRLTVRWI
jgi:ABC-2 type transport system permease protein